MDTLGFTAEEVINVFKIVASVLKLGNITFLPTNNIDGTEGCTVNNEYGKYFNNRNNNLLECCFLQKFKKGLMQKKTFFY